MPGTVVGSGDIREQNRQKVLSSEKDNRQTNGSQIKEQVAMSSKKEN